MSCGVSVLVLPFLMVYTLWTESLSTSVPWLDFMVGTSRGSVLSCLPVGCVCVCVCVCDWPIMVTSGVMELGAESGLKLPSSCGHLRTGTTLVVLEQPALTHCQRHPSGDLWDEAK